MRCTAHCIGELTMAALYSDEDEKTETIQHSSEQRKRSASLNETSTFKERGPCSTPPSANGTRQDEVSNNGRRRTSSLVSDTVSSPPSSTTKKNNNNTQQDTASHLESLQKLLQVRTIESHLIALEDLHANISAWVLPYLTAMPLDSIIPTNNNKDCSKQQQAFPSTKTKVGSRRCFEAAAFCMYATIGSTVSCCLMEG